MLHWLVTYNRLDFMQYLFDHREDAAKEINAFTTMYVAPIDMLWSNEQVPMADFLLSHGADININSNVFYLLVALIFLGFSE